MNDIFERKMSSFPNTDVFHDVQCFHRKFGLEYDGPPRQLPTELQSFRTGFLYEELEEYVEACTAMREAAGREDLEAYLDAMEKAFDALIDLVYVAVGTADLHGFKFNQGWQRVQAANMAKVRCERPGDSKRGSTFDVIKPEGWTPPSLRDIVRSMDQ